MADKFTIKFDAQMEIGQLKTAVGQIQQEFKKVQIPQNAIKPLTNTLEQLSKEIENFEKLTSKDVGSKADFGKIEKSSQHLLELWQKLSNSYNNLTQLSDNKLKKLFPEEISNNIKKAVIALKDYEKQTGEIDDNIKKIENSLKKAQEAQEKLTKDIEKENSKKIVDTEGFNNFKKEIQATEKELSEYKKKLEEINNFIAQKEATLNYPKKSNPYGKAVKEAEELSKTITEVQEKLDNLYNDSTNITTKEQHVKDLAKINEKYKEAGLEVEKFSKQLKEAEESGINSANEAFSILAKTLKDLLGLDISDLGTDSKAIGEAIEQYVTNKVNQMRQSVESAKTPIQNFGQVAEEASKKTHALGEEVKNFDQRAKEIDSIKARVTAFFGLNNAIMLARRALRSAYETVKELDKAMTETAVVTNFSVGDMWAQLPEYTKRANELGVTTLEAYQASTLFYQQGLKTNEVVALSNETLKMARIAGLDAAEATDRMTNALRGFNMTLTETNAQRIDDVYSKLAAITASNVDEISTAMTKVASLAHNANMEFETTSAFLAQIIETTRESAETAGTALKTVVARFSEVKDLYTKEELTGTDEEGEVIDVNKISKALRTAGIDLNRYFLGTVGLDDIFMELAEKWDSLTNVQQRYIATQAAGSRQQSRFIALMSDYARTQELVSAAYDANGAAAEQFEKTQDSLQSKLARLKNAWDEFTMGLANSTLIKTGVELLTGVLDAVNKLTTGFGSLTGKVGSFISALLKVGVIAGARSLAKGPTAVLINSLGSVIGLGGVSNKEAYVRSVLGNDSDAFENLKNASWKSIFKQQFLGTFNNIKDRRAARADSFTKYSSMRSGLDVIGDLEEARDLTKFETKALSWGSKGLGEKLAETPFASKLSKVLGMGTSAAGAKAAAGIVSMGAAFVGVAAAATAAYGVIKMLYEASPEGQIKYAEQVKNEIDHTKSSLEATKKTLDETLDSYNQQLDSLSKLEEGTIEWANAFLEVNKTVSDLIERFPKLAAYVTTTSNGLLQLDQRGLAQYQKELNEQIGKYSALSIMATGGVAQRKAMASKEATEAAGQQYLAEVSFSAAARNLTKNEYTDEVYKAFAKNFDFNKWAKEAGESTGSGTGNFLGIGTNIFKSRGKLRQEYKELTGQEADANWNANQLADAIGQFNNTEKIEEYLNNINILVDGIAKAQDEGQEGASDFQDIITGIANEEATNMANSIMGQYSQIFSEKDLEKIASSAYGFGTYDVNTISEVQSSFEQIAKWAQERSGLDEQAFNAAIQKFYNVNTLAEAGYALYKDILNNSEQFDITRQETNKAVNERLGYVGAKAFDEFMSNSNLIDSVSNEVYSKLGEVFTELSLSGVNVAETFKNLTPEAAEFLAQLDISSPDVIRMVINQLESMGVEIDNEVIDRLINLADASTAAAEALEGINKSANLYKQASELKDRESYIFSGEEYAQYKEYDEEGFYQVSSDLYVYIRDGFDKLIEGLSNKGITIDESTLNNLQGNIESGEEIEKAALDMLRTPAAALGREGIEKILQNRYSADQWANYENLEQLRATRSNIGNSRAFYGPVRDLNNKEDIKARFNSELSNNAKLLTQYNQINDSIKEQIESHNQLIAFEEQREALAEKTSLQYSDTIKEYQNLISTINENKDSLLIEDKQSSFYKEAVQSIASEIEKIYGISHDSAVKFVEEHEEAILEATKNTEDFQNFLSLIAETWINENSSMIQSTADAMKTSVSSIEDMLTEIANNIKDLPDGEIGFDVKTDEALQKLEAYGFKVEDFMKSMGFELVASPGSEILVPNPGYAAMANIPTPDGTNLAQAAGIPEFTKVPSSRFIWRRIGSADAQVSPPPGGGGGGSTTKEILQSDLLKQNYEKQTQKRETELAAGNEEAAEEIKKTFPDLILEIVAQLRKEAGLNLDDFSTLEIQDEDTQEILQWLQKYWEEIQKEQPLESEKLKEELSLLERQRELAEAEGASDEELAQLDQEILDKTNLLIEVLRQENGGGSDTEEIINYLIKAANLRKSLSGTSVSPWLNDPDRYYDINNLLEELNHTGKQLTDALNKYLNDPNYSGNDIIEAFADVLANKTSLATAYGYKEQELRTDREGLLREYSEYIGKYLIDDNGRLRINQEAINSIDSQEEYENVSKAIEEITNIEDLIWDTQDNQRDTIQEIADLKKSVIEQIRNSYIQMQQTVVNQLIDNQREMIEQQKEEYERINEANRSVLESMQEQISLERQIRDNTKTEDEIRQLESRLAYLQRDTTGSNAQEILKLQKDIEDKRNNYQDKLVDQQMTELQKQNAREEKARNQEIEYLADRLDEQIRIGYFNNEAIGLIKSAISPEGNLIEDSSLVSILQKSENWDKLTAEQRQILMDTWGTEFQKIATYFGVTDEKGSFNALLDERLKGVANVILGEGEENKGINGIIEAINSFRDQVIRQIDEVAGKLSGEEKDGSTESGSSSSGSGSTRPSNYDSLVEEIAGNIKSSSMYVPDEAIEKIYTERTDDNDPVNKQAFINDIHKKLRGYATGGTVSFTGPAWLDGTSSQPEYVLNAQQTQAFLKLAEVLPNILKTGSSRIVDNIKNVYLNLTMNVDEIADDYDVDQIAERVKEIIYDASEYRNTNMLDFSI